MSVICRHLDQIALTTTDLHVCEDCVKLGGSWLHLRLCLSCGHVGCCDSSKNRHASRHFLRTTHPLVRSIEAGERWIWCYADEVVPGELPE
ncbi:MAG: UBP-type zinc finger domain-containing protein [Croceibacterium sp.]